mgnify:CR=1 FL=1
MVGHKFSRQCSLIVVLFVCVRMYVEGVLGRDSPRHAKACTVLAIAISAEDTAVRAVRREDGKHSRALVRIVHLSICVIAAWLEYRI